MPGWKKGALCLRRMVERSTVRLRQLACHRAEEVKLGRLLRNDRVSLAALNRAAGERVGERARGCRHVLAIQDTTELNFQRHARRTQGLGPVGNGTDQGLFLHPLLAIEAMASAVWDWPGPSCGCGAARSPPGAASGRWRRRNRSAGERGSPRPNKCWARPRW